MPRQSVQLPQLLRVQHVDALLARGDRNALAGRIKHHARGGVAEHDAGFLQQRRRLLLDLLPFHGAFQCGVPLAPLARIGVTDRAAGSPERVTRCITCRWIGCTTHTALTGPPGPSCPSCPGLDKPCCRTPGDPRRRAATDAGPCTLRILPASPAAAVLHHGAQAAGCAARPCSAAAVLAPPAATSVLHTGQTCRGRHSMRQGTSTRTLAVLSYPSPPAPQPPRPGAPPCSGPATARYTLHGSSGGSWAAAGTRPRPQSPAGRWRTCVLWVRAYVQVCVGGGWGACVQAGGGGGGDSRQPQAKSTQRLNMGVRR